MLRTILNVFCMIVWYSSALRSVWDVLCRICGYDTVLRTVLYVFCLIIWYVCSLRTFLNVFCKNCSHVSVLCTVLNVFCIFLWYVSALRTLLNVFWKNVFPLVFCAPSWMCSAWLLGTVIPRALFWLGSVRFFCGSAVRTILNVFCLMVCHATSLRSVFCVVFECLVS